MTKKFDTLLTYLNNDKKVFVEVYEHYILLQVTKDNIHLIKTLDLSDEMLDDESYNMTQQSKISYYSQDFGYNTDVLGEGAIALRNRFVEEMKTFLSSVSVDKIYHIDCEADVYIVS